MIKNLKTILFVCVGLLLVLAGCKRDEYYIDGGKAQADYPGSMFEYLEQKPVPFDTIAQVVKLAGMEDVFRNEDFTFFAPDDDVVKRTIGSYTSGGLNRELFLLGRDTVKQLSDISPVVWRKYLMRYMFKGVNRLKDYPQIDLNLQSQYPGQLYYTYGNDVCNIGVIYGDANGVKYIGPRKLNMIYVPDISNPNFATFINPISSSDIKPRNGVVHTLAYSGATLGYSYSEFINDVYFTGLTSSSN